MTQPNYEVLLNYLNDGKYVEVIDIGTDELFGNSLVELPFMKITALLKLRRWNESKQIIDELEENDTIVNNPIYEIRHLNLKAKYLLETSKTEPALQINEKVQLKLNSLPQKIKDEHVKEIIDFKVNRARYYYIIGDYEVARNYFLEAIALTKNSPYISIHGEIMWRLSEIYRQEGNIERARELIEEKLDYYHSLSNSFQIAQTYVELADLEIELANYSISLSHLDTAEKFNNNDKSPLLTWRIENARARCFQYQGQLNEAIEKHEANISIAQLLGSRVYEGDVYNNVGIIYHMKGDLDFALQYLFRSLAISEEFEDSLRMATSYNNIALNYKLKGEFDKALDFLRRSLEIYKKYGDASNLATSYVNLGLTLQLKGDYKDAEKYYLKCLDIDRRSNNDVNTTETLYNLVILDLEMDNESRANDFMVELEEIAKSNENPIVQIRRDIARVNILKRSKRSINQAKAQELLMNIINNDPIDYELYVEAMFLQCELLLYELRYIGEEEVFEELGDMLDKLESFASEQQSFSLLAEIYLMKSRLLLLNLDLDRSISYIEKAEQICKERDLDKLLIKVSAQHDSLLDQVRKMEDLTERDTTLAERVRQINLDEVFTRVLNSKSDELKAIPETPFMFYIIVEGGTTIYKKRFDNEFEYHEDLVAGLFSAIHSLSDEVFRTTKSVQRIKHENYTILLKPIEALLFCYVFRGQSYNAVKKIDFLIQAVTASETIWKALNRDIPQLTSLENDGMDLLVQEIFSED